MGRRKERERNDEMMKDLGAFGRPAVMIRLGTPPQYL